MKVGINGAVRDISDLKVGASGAVRAVSEAYIGVAGATKKVWPNKKALNDCTWDEISEISSSGEAASMFKVGDCKEIVLNGTVGALTFEDYHTYAYIIGFDHNAAVEGDHRIHFQLAMSALEGGQNICFVDSYYDTSDGATGFKMNTSITNSGGWEDSYMRRDILGQRIVGIVSNNLINALPNDLIDVLKTVTKYTDNTGNGSTTASAVTATTDYIFLLSEYETFGSCTYANSNEASRQQQYAYYSAGNSKVKYRHNSTGSSAYWWLRSPNRYNSSGFVLVSSNGSARVNGAPVSLGLAPGFCV